MDETATVCDAEKTVCDTEKEEGLFGKLKGRVKRSLSAINEHCESVEKAKEANDRENLKKYGKDWVNRCCG